MNTAVGASAYLPAGAIDPALIADAAILYVEGYMWRTEQPRAAVRDAIRIARGAGRKVAFTLSSEFCIREHRADFVGLLDDGGIDMLFANEGELAELSGLADFDAGVAWAAARAPLTIVTRGAAGAIAVEAGARHAVPAEPAGPVLDTTGAGDLFAAGFLAGLIEGRALPAALRMGSIAAGRIITLTGPRLPADIDLRQLIAARLRAAGQADYSIGGTGCGGMPSSPS